MLDVQWSLGEFSAATAVERADAEHSTRELCDDRDDADYGMWLLIGEMADSFGADNAASAARIPGLRYLLHEV